MSETNEKTVSIPQKDWEEFQSRLKDAEEHRKGLLVHSQNLEHLLSESGKHLGNIENLLREKDSDLSQHQIKLKELEARCYRLEQQLQEYENESQD